MKKKILIALALIGCISMSHAAGDVIAGKMAFAKCANCHQVGPSARGAFGPQLNAIVGRQAGTSKDFAYSAAMKNSRIVWSEASLRAFIKSPNDVVPGNKMRFYGISNEKQIADLIAYLRKFE
ncbi:cytochrome c [Herminiimonas fonticola]|uniref:Cytochrome c n=2 Tax=Herminiimonas fonticola TaxID=303380 RepID=A0A4R6G7I1_9BURK|nr:Cytochrome c2 [Herminiimonas fonticola]TDN89724.1 cytochrome c [Herminiimonas fonticola]